MKFSTRDQQSAFWHGHAWTLLRRRFSFILSARVDDLMISSAADGGVVGPHDDR